MQEEFDFKLSIQRNFGALKSGVKMSTISDFLIEKGVLQMAEWKDLKSSEMGEDERTEKFLFDLCEKTVNEFRIFIEALRKSRHEKLATRLEDAYSHKSKRGVQEEHPNNPQDLLHVDGLFVEAQVSKDTQKREKGEETRLFAVLQSMHHDQEMRMEKAAEEQRKMAEKAAEEQRKMAEKAAEEQRKMAAVIERMDMRLIKGAEEQEKTNEKLQNIEQEMGKLRKEVKSKVEENLQLTEENERLKIEIEKQRKQIDAARLELEQVLKLRESDQIKNDELAEKFRELQKAKDKIENGYKKILENVASYETKFAELMGKEVSFENSLTHLEIYLRKEQRSKASLSKELEEKTQTSQHVVQLKGEIEQLNVQVQSHKKIKEDMEMKMQELKKSKNAINTQYEFLLVKYKREIDSAVTFKKY